MRAAGWMAGRPPASSQLRARRCLAKRPLHAVSVRGSEKATPKYTNAAVILNGSSRLGAAREGRLCVPRAPSLELYVLPSGGGQLLFRLLIHLTRNISCGRIQHGAEGDRTPDLCSAIAALSQLSYSPATKARRPDSHRLHCTRRTRAQTS